LSKAPPRREKKVGGDSLEVTTKVVMVIEVEEVEVIGQT
jgi:hypothetical protein